MVRAVRVAVSAAALPPTADWGQHATKFKAQGYVLAATLFAASAAFVCVPRYAHFSRFMVGTFLVFALTLTCVAISLCFQSRWVAPPGVVSYIDSPGQTRFARSPAIALTLGLSLTLIMAAGAGFVAYTVASGFVSHGRAAFAVIPRSAWVFALLFLIQTVMMWRGTRRAALGRRGATVAPGGVTVAQLLTTVDVNWHHIADARMQVAVVATTPKARAVPCLAIELTSGDVLLAEATELGSDPNAVAAFIRYYRDNPRARERLVDPAAAISHFSEAQETR